MPALVGLAGAILVVAPPQAPGIAVRLVAAGPGDDGAAELPEQLGDSDGDQAEDGGVAVTGALPVASRVSPAHHLCGRRGKSPVPGVRPKTFETAPSPRHSLSKSASRRVPVSNREIVAPECSASFPAWA
jgi:hypothetical protein